MHGRRLVAPLSLGLLLLLAPGPAVADGSPPENPFEVVARNLRLGATVRTRGAILMALRLPPAAQPGLTARVGLAGTETRVLPLPGLAGRWHVRLTNHEPLPLLVPAGETLLTPMRPSRSVDRSVWIPAHSATFVPVVQTGPDVAAGPYVSRGQGLSPVELSLIPPDRWAERVHRRNRLFGVQGPRLDDAGAAYATPGFAAVRERYRAPLDALARSAGVVGVVVCDDRGPHFAEIQTDRGRFEARWPSLRDAIILDAAMLEASGAAPRPGDEPQLRATVRRFLEVLGSRPLRRPTFGQGWEYRWSLTDPVGTWDGLALAEGPVSLRLHVDARRPAGARPPTGPNEPPERPTQPGIFEGERRARPTELERRLEERRRRLLPGGRTQR